MENQNGLVCNICQKKFSRVSGKNQHLRNMHNQASEEKAKFIKCPICPGEKKNPFSHHDNLILHLTGEHGINIKQSIFNFRDIEEFKTWRAQGNREVDFAYTRSIEQPSGEKYMYYSCNRSDLKGFKSNCKQRSMKAEGSIKILDAVCPSRIVAKITKSGLVNVKFIETHVGHEDELRTKRLLKEDQELIVNQLNAGVSTERIIQDARRISNNQLQRRNLVTRTDLRYLVRKFNIDKKRDSDDMIATLLKVEEWNRNGKNHGFLFKKIGESHPLLMDEDFAVGYMNDIMEKKLKNFKMVICVDGTHGTNRLNFELTTVLVKDEQNMGFPVAFLITNRMDQLVQEVFFRALKEKIGEEIQADYLMSDDDPKYFNAWNLVMNSKEKTRRLLCTWHVIKNWNIQGRSKLKREENKLSMKKEMRNILKETNVENFLALKEKYLNHLKEEGEVDFLKYLERYYFQSDARIKMWAHCFRVNVGINTNMAIESLNKVLKHNKMQGNRNIRIEKLLDLLEELVNEKMWKRILNMERPNSDNYQHKVTVKAHLEGEKIKHVEPMDVGKFQVKSTSGEKFYIISYNDLCDEDCRNVYCNECKVCIHRYICDCPERTVKTALCKHIHAVVMYEKRSESVLGLLNPEEEKLTGDEDILCIQEPTTSKSHYQEEVAQYIEETCKNQREEKKSFSLERNQEITIEEVSNFVKTLGEDSLGKFQEMFRTFKKTLEGKNVHHTSKKRKVEKQTYYPKKN